MDKKEQHNFALIAIVAIVAIIALVVLVTNQKTPESGQAMRMSSSPMRAGGGIAIDVGMTPGVDGCSPCFDVTCPAKDGSPSHTGKMCWCNGIPTSDC